jgi:hypothetical protein
VLEEGQTVCCYAKSEKSWIEDPQGVRWETFLTTGESTVYGSDELSSAACCAPAQRAGVVSESCCTTEQKAQARADKAACCA